MGRFRPEDNPFAPGIGTEPGHLAGRDEELGEIALALSRVAGTRRAEAGPLEKTPLTPIKIVGPRGVGKTTLLSEARDMAKAKGVFAVEVAELNSLHAKGSLCSQLTAIRRGKGLWGKVQKHLARMTELAAAPAGAALGVGGQQEHLRRVLEQCLRIGPLALLMDEAMEYEPEALGSLLRACQQMISYKYPLALLLAGTPDLDRNLAKTRAAFIERSNNLYINALEPEATREALQKPFMEHGAEVRDGALKLMMEMTDGYPFFIQLVGNQVWHAMALAGREEVDEETVRKAEEKIQQERNDFYHSIYDKMRKAHLTEHALHVMEVLCLNDGRATQDTIIGSLAKRFAEDGEDQAMEVFYKLIDLGFIWQKDDRMEAGIPSFFTFCETQHRKKNEEKEPSPD